MQLLNIHERIVCCAPCIIEGETGVSKTALTKMYAVLRNSSLQAKAAASTQTDLLDICHSLREQSLSIDSFDSSEDPVKSLHRKLQEAAELTIGTKTEVAAKVYKLVTDKCKTRSALFRPVPPEFVAVNDARTKSATAFLDWFGRSELEPTFFEVNVDASLTETDVVSNFNEIRSTARRLVGLEGALVVVFLDGTNVWIR